MKLKSFGCSFIFGTDLHDDGRDGPWATSSQFTWPALLARELGYEYRCKARPGSGNLQILERLINSIALDTSPTLFVIGWTWIDRFDYISENAPIWMPSRSPVNWTTIMPIDTTDVAKLYYRDLHSEFRDKLVSLQCIKTAIDLLKARNCQFIMTCMDSLVLDQERNVSPSLKFLQDEIRPYLSDFDGKNFVDYSRDRGHEISATMHPLESAHEDAARLVLDNLSNFVKS